MRSTDSPMDDYERWAGFDAQHPDAGDLADEAWSRHRDDPEPKDRREYHQQRALTAGEIAAKAKLAADLALVLRLIHEAYQPGGPLRRRV